MVTPMRIAPLLLAACLATPAAALAQGVAVDAAYVKTIKDWRARAEKSLRRDDGWLTLAGRYVLKPGENRFGTAPTNDIVFPKGLGPAGMGSVERLVTDRPSAMPCGLSEITCRALNDQGHAAAS